MNEVFVVSAFFVVLREVLEATLISGAILAFLRRTGATQFRVCVWGGLLAGLVVSVLFAVTLGLLFSLRGSRPFSGRAGRIFEGVLFLVATALLTWLIVWMSSGRAPVRKMEKSLEGLLEREDRFAAKVALFAMVFLTVCREGLETIVFLVGAAESGARFQWKGIILPAALALLIGVILGFALFNGLVSLDLGQFLIATGALLLFFSAGLLSHGFHAFQSARVFGARSKWWNRGLWDTSACCDDTYNEFFSALRSLFGYNDSPSFIEFIAYSAYWAIVAPLAAIQHRAQLQGMRGGIAVVVRSLTVILCFCTGLAVIFACRHPTWNGLLVSFAFLSISLVCILVVFDCFSMCVTALKRRRQAIVFGMSIVTLLCTIGLAVLHVLQMACEDRFVAGESCHLGRFFYLGILFSHNWLVRTPEYSSWNAIAALSVSLVVCVIYLGTYAGALLLFAGNLDDMGSYTYRAIVPAKDITEEMEVTEADIVSDEAQGRRDSLMHPWLSPPPSPIEPDLEAELVPIPRRPPQRTTRVTWDREKYPVQG